MTSSFPLSVGVGRYDRTQPLIDGRIRIEGCDATIETPPLEILFERAFDHEAYDVAELSFSNYLYLTSIGQCPYVALPIFPSRMFRHSAIFIRTDRGIGSPQDLAGRVVGVREYSMTAALAARGMLSDEYSVPASTIQWRYGRFEAGEDAPVVRMTPRGIAISEIDSDDNLSDMLANGDVDALVAYKPPSCLKRGAPNVARLFPAHDIVEEGYFAHTGIFPIMHLIAVRRSLAEQRPDICIAICDAFEASKNAALAALSSYQAAEISHPWAPLEAGRLQKIFGKNIWPYGVAANKAAIEANARWSFEQGLAQRQLSIEEMFADAAISWKSEHTASKLKIAASSVA